MQTDENQDAPRTSITLWRYWCSPSVLRRAVEALPAYDPSHERGHISFRFESELTDHSLALCDIRVAKPPEEKVRFVYEVHMLHVRGSVVALCCRREIAWLIRNQLFGDCRLGTVELDAEALSHDHASNVEKLHCRLENNPQLNEIALGGPDVMRSDLFRQLGSATYLSVSFRVRFGQKDDAGFSIPDPSEDKGLLFSRGLRGAFSEDTVASVTCTRSGAAGIEPAISPKFALSFSQEVLKYERRSRDWQS